MSQITRCPACKTSFRVVADQLRISGGWVRCGRCKEVFDANVNMLLSGNAAQFKRAAPPPAPLAAQPTPAPAPDAGDSDAQANLSASTATPAEQEQRPQVWVRPRSAALDPSTEESPAAPSSAPATPRSDAVAVPQSAVPIQQPAPWTGYFAPAPNVRLPESLTQNISYGLRREANVVPPGWTPEMDGSSADGHAPARETRHVSAPFVAVPSGPIKPTPLGGEDVTRVEPSFVVDEEPHHAAPAPDEADAEEHKAPAVHAQESDAESEEAEDSELPELTFEASRQHLFIDEPTLRELHMHPEDRGRSEPALADEESADPSDEGEDASAADSGSASSPAEESTEEPTATVTEQEQEATGKPVVDEAVVAPSGLSGEDTEKSAVPQGQAPEPQDDLPGDTPQPEAEMSPLPDADEHAHDVGFIRAARRKAFWSRPAVRGALVLGSLALVALLAGQYAVAERNRLAATYPAMRPVIEYLCMPLRCEIGAPRQIAAISIDSSTFTRTRDDADTFQLLVTLKSSAPTVLEMPALELTLTDAQNQPVLRRVLLRTDTGAAAELPVSGEWSGAVRLHVPEVAQRVVGYRLLAFYP